MDAGQMRTIPLQTLATIQQTAVQPMTASPLTISPVRIFVLALGAAGIGLVLWMHYRHKKPLGYAETFRQLTGPDMLKQIASESKSPEEYARRAEAWASAEAKPPSIARLAAAYRRAKPGATAKLIREARKRRLAQTDARWKRLISEPEEEEYVEIF